MDRITHPDLLLSENDLPSATFVGKENDLAGMRLEKYQNFLSNSNTIPSLSTPDDAEIS